MGRPRKPTNLKVIAGTDTKHPQNGHEPEPDLLEELEPPEHLPAKSAAVWRELAPVLRRIKVLTVADVVAFELLCDAIADYRRARGLRGDNFVTTSPKTGAEMLDQMLVAQQMVGKRAEAMMAKFGMDPASRTRIMIAPQGELFPPENPAPQTGTGRFFAK